MNIVATWDDIVAAEHRIRPFLSPAPLIRSYALERALGLPTHRRVWIKDYGWTPVGSFKVLGALNWTACHLHDLTNRPITAHSSGNFASGLSFASQQFGKRAIIVMPETAPRVKFDLTQRFGAEIRTYDITTDHLTGTRDRMAKEIAEQEDALQASPYDDNHVIAGNGVGGLEIARSLMQEGRAPSHFICAVSGGGLMAGHALALKHVYPGVQVIAVEPSGANDFLQSMSEGKRVRVAAPQSICDGLLSYDVGMHNWPILHRHVDRCIAISDDETKRAMKWLWDFHGLRTEPSGAITTAALLHASLDWSGDGDIVVVLSGRNVDDAAFERFCQEGSQ